MDYPDTWTFKNKFIAASFDCHVREQLPWYDLVSSTVLLSVAKHYIPFGGMVYDVGCATGHVSKILTDTLCDRKARFVGIDSSQAMIDSNDGFGHKVCADAEDFEYEPFDFCIVFLTAIFIPVAKRPLFFLKLKDSMKEGGAIFLVERFLPDGGYNGIVSTRLTLQAKIDAGCSTDEIIKKELSLSGVQRPLDRSEIKGHEIFRFGDFSAYIIDRGYYDR